MTTKTDVMMLPVAVRRRVDDSCQTKVSDLDDKFVGYEYIARCQVSVNYLRDTSYDINDDCPSTPLIHVVCKYQSTVYRPTRHIIGHLRDDFTGHMTQPTVS